MENKDLQSDKEWNLDTIKKLLEAIRDSDFSEFEMEDGKFKIKVRKVGMPIVDPMAIPAAPTLVPIHGAPAAKTIKQTEKTYLDDKIKVIKSPIVGTFYRAATPDSQPFVNVGQKIVENTPVCIIEAMKVMSEVQAEIQGTILEVLVENGHPVQFGQPLFKVQTE